MSVELSRNFDLFQVYLRDLGLPIQEWGSGSAKEVVDLWNEVRSGDVSLKLMNGELVRNVSHVEVMVFHRHNDNLLQLFEEKQVFHADGRMRQRLYPWVAEKIHGPSEDSRNAFNRALTEELNITSDYCFFAPAVNESIILESQTYPGLKTNYDIWRTKASIGDSVFLPEGYCEIGEKKSTYFRWLKIASFDQHLSSSEQVRAVLEERGHIGQ